MTLLCDAARSTLVAIDLQARLLPAIHHGDEVIARTVLLARVARLAGVPVLGTEQNPAGLGPNVEQIRPLCDQTFSKKHFDATAEPGLLGAINGQRDEVVVAGCEAHVCVLQTVLGLLEKGYRVKWVTDATGSRRSADKAAAIERARLAGAIPVSSEMVVFEWMRHSDHAAFSEVLRLVK